LSTDFKLKGGLGYKILSLPNYLDDTWAMILLESSIAKKKDALDQD